MEQSTKQCPFCGELILEIAIKCKFCGSLLNDGGEEIILADQAANLSRGIENVGGRIKVTSRRILFNSHILNVQSFPNEIPLNNIDKIEKKSSMGIFPNVMVLILKSGLQYKFTVNGRDRLISIIENELKK